MIVGLTGGVGCGKSTALAAFSRLGWFTIDADTICHDLYRQRHPKLFRQLREHWQGKSVFRQDGSLDRNVVAEIVFNDQQELEWLNSVIHPLVKTVAEEEIKQADTAWCLFDVPLLFEAGWQAFFDQVVCVWIPSHMQRDRLLARGWSADQVTKRTGAQLANEAKLERANHGIINTGGPALLVEQCEMIDKRLRSTN